MKIVKKIVKSKVLQSGFQVNIETNENASGDYFALGKKYWIVFNGNSTRNVRNRSDNLKYLEKILEKMV